MKSIITLTLIVTLLVSCVTKEKEVETMKITKEKFGMADGKEVNLYTLTNKNGMIAKITNYGAIVQTLTAPDKNGKYEDIVLGYDKLEDYLKGTPYFGAIVGRYGNRIKLGKFSLNGQEYTLATNNDPNHLHGGLKGFDKVVWDAEPLESETSKSLKLTYISKDGEEGYPGNLKATVIYSLTDKGELSIEYFAKTDKTTPVNLTHHGYFNLSGNCKTDILSHKLWINAARFTPVDKTSIPNGELRPVKDSAFDFTTATAIGARVNNDEEQLKFGLGYDHNWVLNDVDSSLKLQASLHEESSGRFMEIYTVEPGLQFYCGNFLDGSNVGKGGKVYKYRTGLCLETQHYPDSPNKPEFPSTILEPGQSYHTKTVYKFLAK